MGRKHGAILAVFIFLSLAAFAFAATVTFSFSQGWNLVYNRYDADIPVSQIASSCPGILFFTLNEGALKKESSYLGRGEAYIANSKMACSYEDGNAGIYEKTSYKFHLGWNVEGFSADVPISDIEKSCGDVKAFVIYDNLLIEEKNTLKQNRAYLIRVPGDCIYSPSSPPSECVSECIDDYSRRYCEGGQQKTEDCPYGCINGDCLPEEIYVPAPVERTFRPVIASPGEEVEITLYARPESSQSYYYVRDAVPSGWEILTADGRPYSSSGMKKGEYREVKYDITSAGPFVHRYTVRVPSDACGRYKFSGTYRMEGESEKSIGGKSYLIARCR